MNKLDILFDNYKFLGVKITDLVLYKIERLPNGFVFTYSDFIDEVDKKEAIIKTLNRLASAGKIMKLSKGRFYKAEESPFGTLQPDQRQIVKDLLEKDGKLIGYITGLGVYNQLKLSTQLSFVIQIGRNVTRPAIKRGMYRIEFVRQKNVITKENIPLLQLLDAIRFIKKIPDTTLEASCKRLKALLNELDEKQKRSILRLSLKYPPATRALLGALLEDMGLQIDLSAVKKSLNPITAYHLNISPQLLSTSLNWNIK